MNRKMLCRAGLLIAMAVIFTAALVCSMLPETVQTGRSCLGVPILTEQEMTRFTAYRYQDHSEDLKFQNEHAAVDKVESVLYISQNIEEETTVEDLVGSLSIDLPGWALFFAPDENWSDLKGAVRSGESFRLLVSGPAGTYMEYEVVFTTLPVMYLYGQYVFTNANDRNVSYGRVVLWDPQRMDGQGGGIHSSHLQWHIRGGSSSNQEKAPWKLSLKNGEGKNNNANLLGLGSDDDWILNAMNREDSNIREKLFMDLWNEMAAETPHNYPMSRGEYVEVLINGEYYGLYLLQRRIDTKYLALEEDTVLMKAEQVDEEILYEYVSSPYSESIPHDLIDRFFLEGDCQAINLDNFVDVSLFLNLFSARDNQEYKNMFYVFDREEDDWSIRLIPWDTDISMASFWVRKKGFEYNYEGSLNYNVKRQELKTMEQFHPALDQSLGIRWQELRQSMVTVEHIHELMDGYLKTLEESCADVRDREKWGLYYEGQDTIDNLYRFVEERLAVLDAQYAGG